MASLKMISRELVKLEAAKKECLSRITTCNRIRSSDYIVSPGKTHLAFRLHNDWSDPIGCRIDRIGDEDKNVQFRRAQHDLVRYTLCLCPT
jgi:hypothetical protein